jgi:hypothetical protein
VVVGIVGERIQAERGGEARPGAQGERGNGMAEAGGRGRICVVQRGSWKTEGKGCSLDEPMGALVVRSHLVRETLWRMHLGGMGWMRGARRKGEGLALLAELGKGCERQRQRQRSRPRLRVRVRVGMRVRVRAGMRVRVRVGMRVRVRVGMRVRVRAGGRHRAMGQWDSGTVGCTLAGRWYGGNG